MRPKQELFCGVELRVDFLVLLSDFPSLRCFRLSCSGSRNVPCHERRHVTCTEKRCAFLVVPQGLIPPIAAPVERSWLDLSTQSFEGNVEGRTWHSPTLRSSCGSPSTSISDK